MSVSVFFSQVGILQYGEIAVHEWSLKDYQTTEDVVQAAKNINRQEGRETRTAYAIQMAWYDCQSTSPIILSISLFYFYIFFLVSLSYFYVSGPFPPSESCVCMWNRSTQWYLCHWVGASKEHIPEAVTL